MVSVVGGLLWSHLQPPSCPGGVEGLAPSLLAPSKAVGDPGLGKILLQSWVPQAGPGHGGVMGTSPAHAVPEASF